MDISHGGNPKNHFREVLSIWEKNLEPPFNWCTILSILSAPIIGCNALADEIAAILQTQDKTDSLSTGTCCDSLFFILYTLKFSSIFKCSKIKICVR